MTSQRVRRAMLFMPGDDRRKIEKGASTGAVDPKSCLIAAA